MTIASYSPSNAVKGASVPISWPTQDPDWQMLVFGVRVGASDYLDRSSSTTTPARSAPAIELGPTERAIAARSPLFNTELLQHYGCFEAKVVCDCLRAKPGRLLVSP
ncbi:hypothetical protein [Ferrimicrobium acidiphilum]|uniref:hypothetical protein n=1 Tax=Ferrimicrobium acidiphilum TaxID=121039 RepID=UPI0023F0A6FD|nr:hypothetical protein [Ferrimicrobium acidiphilum]